MHQTLQECEKARIPDLGAVDDVFAKSEVWTRGHIFEVRFAETGRVRWIGEVIREISDGPRPNA